MFLIYFWFHRFHLSWILENCLKRLPKHVYQKHYNYSAFGKNRKVWLILTLLPQQVILTTTGKKFPINLLKMVTWCTNTLTFNNCTFCPHCIYVFCIYLRTNSGLCHLHHKLIGFYNRDEKCLLRGTNWIFKYSSLRFVFKGLITLRVKIFCVFYEYSLKMKNLYFQQQSEFGHIIIIIICKLAHSSQPNFYFTL
jgi:hypothetical protein